MALFRRTSPQQGRESTRATEEEGRDENKSARDLKDDSGARTGPHRLDPINFGNRGCGADSDSQENCKFLMLCGWCCEDEAASSRVTVRLFLARKLIERYRVVVVHEPERAMRGVCLTQARPRKKLDCVMTTEQHISLCGVRLFPYQGLVCVASQRSVFGVGICRGRPPLVYNS